MKITELKKNTYYYRASDNTIIYTKADGGHMVGAKVVREETKYFDAHYTLGDDEPYEPATGGQIAYLDACISADRFVEKSQMPSHDNYLTLN